MPLPLAVVMGQREKCRLTSRNMRCPAPDRGNWHQSFGKICTYFTVSCFALHLARLQQRAPSFSGIQASVSSTNLRTANSPDLMARLLTQREQNDLLYSKKAGGVIRGTAVRVLVYWLPPLPALSAPAPCEPWTVGRTSAWHWRQTGAGISAISKVEPSQCHG